MKQQVNLFSASLLPLKPILPLAALLKYALLVSALSVFMLVIIHFYTSQQQQQLLAQRQQQQQLQAQAELLQQALMQRAPDQALLSTQETLQRQLQQQQVLLQFLGVRQQSSAKYSPVFKHLLVIDQPQLWLDRFVLEPTQSYWQGYTTLPNAVPLWLEQLAQLEQLKGQQFQQMQLQQQENTNLLQFSLQARQGATP